MYGYINASEGVQMTAGIRVSWWMRLFRFSSKNDVHVEGHEMTTHPEHPATEVGAYLPGKAMV